MIIKGFFRQATIAYAVANGVAEAANLFTCLANLDFKLLALFL